MFSGVMAAMRRRPKRRAYALVSSSSNHSSGMVTLVSSYSLMWKGVSPDYATKRMQCGCSGLPSQVPGSAKRPANGCVMFSSRASFPEGASSDEFIATDSCGKAILYSCLFTSHSHIVEIQCDAETCISATKAADCFCRHSGPLVNCSFDVECPSWGTDIARIATAEQVLFPIGLIPHFAIPVVSDCRVGGFAGYGGDDCGASG